jgi:hypothetical protein
MPASSLVLQLPLFVCLSNTKSTFLGFSILQISPSPSLDSTNNAQNETKICAVPLRSEELNEGEQCMVMKLWPAVGSWQFVVVAKRVP